jgi:hypothetical protein
MRNEKNKEVADLLPTLYIGLGGFGKTVITKLKKKIEDILPNDKLGGFAFLVLDTHPFDRGTGLTDREYLPLSIGVTPDTVAQLNSQFLKFYTQLVGRWQTGNIQFGANMVRVVGRLAFRNPPTFREFIDRLRSTSNQIMQEREGFRTSTPKIYVISSLAGGTGSGCFLDVIACVREFFHTRIGTNFKLQAIIVTPDALEDTAGVNLQELYANTYATLKEIYHFLNNEAVQKYDDAEYKEIRIDSTSLPNPLFLLTNKNEKGTIIATSFEELAEIIVSYLLFEIMTPLPPAGAQPRPQDGENIFVGVGIFNFPRRFSSVGTVRFGFPFEEAVDGISYLLLKESLTREIESIQLQNIDNIIDSWINQNNLAEMNTDQLQETLMPKDPLGNPLKITFDIKSDLLKIPRQKLQTECTDKKNELISNMELQYKNKINENKENLLNKIRNSLSAKIWEIFEIANIKTVTHFLEKLIAKIKSHQDSLNKEYKEKSDDLSNLEETIKKDIKTVVQAAQSGWWGRAQRINAAISTFETNLNNYLNNTLRKWAIEKGLEIYNDLIAEATKHLNSWNQISQNLQFINTNLKIWKEECEKGINELANTAKRRPGNRFSLVKWSDVEKLLKDDDKNNIIESTRKALKAKHLLPNIIPDNEKWIESAIAESNLKENVKEALKNFTILEIIEKFYPKDEQKNTLFTTITNLSSPLFPISPNLRERNYHTSLVIAVHPDIKDNFHNNLTTRFLNERGVMYAYFDNPYEVIIYTITHGYTLQSLSSIHQYKRHYSNLQERYNEAQTNTHLPAVPPIHVWEDAHLWDEPYPELMTKEEEEKIKIFAIGFAFSYIYPTPGSVNPDGSIDETKNRAFIYHRGAYYYISDEQGKEIFLGQGIENALNNFLDNLDMVQEMKKRINDQVKQEGTTNVIRKLKEFLDKGKLNDMIERAKNSRDFKREELLHKLKNSLEKYLKELEEVSY